IPHSSFLILHSSFVTIFVCPVVTTSTSRRTRCVAGSNSSPVSSPIYTGADSMFGNLWNKALRRFTSVTRPIQNTSWKHRAAPSLEGLSERIVPAVTASFIPASGTLTVFGDALDNHITVSRNAAGNILVNNGAVSVLGGTPT